ncbi:MAG: hypothetical protein IK078_08915 [Lachnospiraceae bacterium]|nr:hypothetical protein [Lachnospiraceae bacterium]
MTVGIFKRVLFVTQILICILMGILAVVIAATQIICGLMGAAPMDLQHISQAEKDALNLQDTVRSTGGAATYCWLPMLVVFWLSDVWTDEIILEEMQTAVSK